MQKKKTCAKARQDGLNCSPTFRAVNRKKQIVQRTAEGYARSSPEQGKGNHGGQMQPCGQDLPGGTLQAEACQGGDLYTRAYAKGGGGAKDNETRRTRDQARAQKTAERGRRGGCACVRVDRADWARRLKVKNAKFFKV